MTDAEATAMPTFGEMVLSAWIGPHPRPRRRYPGAVEVKREHEMRVAGLYPPPHDVQFLVWRLMKCEWADATRVPGVAVSGRVIWHPCFDTFGPPVRPSAALIRAAQAVGDGHIGPDLPPYQFPRHKPVAMALGPAGYVRFWAWSVGAAGGWAFVTPDGLADGEWWWPHGPMGSELYGNPVGDPTKGER